MQENEYVKYSIKILKYNYLNKFSNIQVYIPIITINAVIVIRNVRINLLDQIFNTKYD